MLDRLRKRGFDIATRNHAEAILSVDFPHETEELISALEGFSITSAELITSGGGEALSTQRMRRGLADIGWRKHNFRIQTTVDGRPIGDGTSHEIDHVRRTPGGTIALEIEWNNKDPFFDRDLENFHRLHGQSVISLGVIVTRGAALQHHMIPIVEAFLARESIADEAGLMAHGVKQRTARQREAVLRSRERGERFASAFARGFVADKFGPSSTHWAKLAERIGRGVGAPCPLLLIGLPLATVSDYSAANPELYA